MVLYTLQNSQFHLGLNRLKTNEVFSSRELQGDISTLGKTVFPHTVFPRNLAAATFNFVVQFGAATFRGRPDFEGGD